MKIKLAIVIPAHNEENNIKKLVETFLEIYPKEIYEIIIVDDNSTDRTGKIVDRLTKKNRKVKVVHRIPPNGVGLAIRDGIRKVNSEATHILTMDADFIDNIPDIKLFLEQIDNYDGLVGSRYLLPNSLIRYPWAKKIANRAFHFLCKILLGIKQKDLTNNFKFYKKEIFDRIPLSSWNFSINAETGIYPIIYGYKIGEVPVKWIGRTESMGLSKFKLFSVGPYYLRVLLMSLLIKWEAPRSKTSS